MSKIVEVKQEKKWEEDSYARTLAEARAIKNDPVKLKMAKAGAKRILEEEMDRISGLKSIASMKEKAIKKIKKK